MTTVTISLPNQIAKKVNIEAKKKGFATRSEFMRSLLREYFVDEAKPEKLEFKEFTRQPLKKIKLDLARTGKYSEEFIESVVKGFSKSSLYEG